MKITSNKQFNIAIVRGDYYVIIDSDDLKEVSERMYVWYVNHAEFFNGSIQLWDNGTCISKTNGGVQND